MAARFNCCVDKKDLVATLDWNQALMKDVSSRLIINYSDTLILLAPFLIFQNPTTSFLQARIHIGYVDTTFI